MNPFTKDKITDVSLYFFAASDELESEGNKYELLLKGAAFADENDLAGIWIPERHFSKFGDRFPNPAVCGAGVAAITKRIRIRSGSVVLPLHDPIRIAEDWAMVDNMSEGRIELAVAPGWHPADFSLAPQNFADRHQKMRDNLLTVVNLWSGNETTRIDGLGNSCKIRIYPQPVQPRLPIWITAAKAEEAFRFAGSIGAKVLTNILLQPKEDLKKKIDCYYESLLANGFSVEDGGVAIMIHTFMSEDAEFTKSVVKEPFKNYLAQFTDLIRPIAEAAGLNVERAKGILAEMGFNRYFNTGGLFGSVEQCIERVEELREYGINEVACLVDFGIETQCTLDHLSNIGKLRREIKLRFQDEHTYGRNKEFHIS